MVAFSNTRGGMLILGVDDAGNVVGIEPTDITRLNMLISNSATNHVKNLINPVTENLVIDGKLVIIIHVREGVDKPYMDNHGAIWVKSEADKRKVTSKEELRWLFQSRGLIYADEMLVQSAGMQDVNRDKFARYFEKVYAMTVEEAQVPFDTLFENLHLAQGGELNLAGLLLFAKSPSRWKPVCMIKGVSFLGNSIGGTDYCDSEIISPGTLPNSLTIENIRYGNSAIRNPIIASFAAQMLPYRGLGSGIIRVLREQPNISIEEDREGEQFKVIIPRPQEQL